MPRESASLCSRLRPHHGLLAIQVQPRGHPQLHYLMKAELALLIIGVEVQVVDHILDNLGLVEIWCILQFLIALNFSLDVLKAAEQLRVPYLFNTLIQVLPII